MNSPVGDPLGILLWAFIGNEIPAILSTYTKSSPDEVAALLQKWGHAVHQKDNLRALEEPDPVKPVPEGPARDYLERLLQQPMFLQFRAQFGECQLGYLSIDHLVTPLALIDCEFVEQLRGELFDTSPLSVARFAVPESTLTPLRAGIEAPRTANFVSSRKTITVSDVQLENVIGGVQVKFRVTDAASFILISRVGTRFYLRTGLHRAYLLAKLGIKELPCIVVNEDQIPLLAAGYPVFSPAILSRSRPPLFADYFDESLALTFPLQRMHKVIRITAEEFLIPVD